MKETENRDQWRTLKTPTSRTSLAWIIEGRLQSLLWTRVALAINHSELHHCIYHSRGSVEWAEEWEDRWQIHSQMGPLLSRFSLWAFSINPAWNAASRSVENGWGTVGRTNSKQRAKVELRHRWRAPKIGCIKKSLSGSGPRVHRLLFCEWICPCKQHFSSGVAQPCIFKIHTLLSGFCFTFHDYLNCSLSLRALNYK